MIRMYSELIPLVRDGKKTATTRLGDKEFKLGNNHIVDTKTNEQILISITKVDKVLFQDLPLSLAQRENYQTVEEFKSKLETIYGVISPSQVMTVIYFKLKCPFCEIPCGFNHCPY